ncbi:topoisomerase I binding, arginine/serine-rich a [Nelusetta ayraudi]|uniref:topoisomerase I binding, arginine/serine-rich a n=1 Tax=Nelusetta ayraudi TaxID=303726 RepID=UPI003F72A527
MSAAKVAVQESQKSGRRKICEEMSGEVSPDSKCPVCLDRFNNMSYLDICLHKFCFPCIHEWSKNKAECPLCKQPFSSIYHSIKSDHEYKRYDLRPVDNGSFGSFGGVRFRYRTTLTGVHRQMQRRTSSPPDNGVMFESLTNASHAPHPPYIRRMMRRLVARRRAASEGRPTSLIREQEMINFRRELYRRGVRVQNVCDDGRSRDISAEFFQRNPACLHRLVPWLKRELSVLYGAHGSLVNIVQHIIMSRITRYDLGDEAIKEELRPFLRGRTDHFLHEFINFAKSPFNMEAYDQRAVYDCVAPSSNEDSSPALSVIAISEDEEQPVGSDQQRETSSSLSNSVWDDDTPGPSYSTSAEQNRTTAFLSLLDTDSDSSVEEDAREYRDRTQQPATDEANPDGPLSSDSDDCILIGFVKPTTERTPELVQLSSDSDESESDDPQEQPPLPQHIRFCSLSPVASQSTEPSSAGASENTEMEHFRSRSKERYRSSLSSRVERRQQPSRRDTKGRFDYSDRFRESSRSKERDHRRRSRSGERRSPAVSSSSLSSAARERGDSYSSNIGVYSKYDRNFKSGDSNHSYRSYMHYSQERSQSRVHYKERHSFYYKYTDPRSYSSSRSRSRSQSRRQNRRRSRSRTYSSSCSPSVRKRSHQDKPGGKRKYKVKHLERERDTQDSDSDGKGDSQPLSTKSKKKSKKKHRRKSKERSRKVSSGNSADVDHEENSERSKHRHKKKKKHKRKSKKHKSEKRDKSLSEYSVMKSESEMCRNDNVTEASSANTDTHITIEPGDHTCL